MQYFIIVISLLSTFTHASEAANTCSTKLDAFIGKYEIYREYSVNNHFSKCLATDKSKIQFKGNPDSRVLLNGFVVGIESFWHQDLNEIVKITTKAGGHTTIVRLLANQYGQSQFTPDFDVTFSSSMAYIVVSKTPSGNLIVTTRDSHLEENCQRVTEDIFEMEGNDFTKVSTTEVYRECR
ncbi:hypothetical protein RT723_02030 [Psychrosphaera aquimarina]|uniref:Uncharacterized protein n=1 Tax=Psychrosphaera aquimarina TaxID=2044854 RepID=A0ABU3QWK2_9GAMM|nr:hypothetical protein [Psychrosphaera aquimarina]MDU0111806.1 hypothetical protein [Psychrosphaera aquimarina]